MSALVKSSRRGFLGMLGALVAAPAIVRAASLMPVTTVPDEEVLVLLARRNSLRTINDITRQAVRLWKNSNEFLANNTSSYDDLFAQSEVNPYYDDAFAQPGAKIGAKLRIRLPKSYTVVV